MKKVDFYIFVNEYAPNVGAEKVSETVNCACLLASAYYRQGKKVFIYTESEADAFDVDEYLWQFDPKRFVPHNLAGEGPKFGSPVEISCYPPSRAYSVLINMSLNAAEFSSRFSEIVDFVPLNEQLKLAARQRYNDYRKLGFTPSTQIFDEHHQLNQ